MAINRVSRQITNQPRVTNQRTKFGRVGRIVSSIAFGVASFGTLASCNTVQFLRGVKQRQVHRDQFIDVLSNFNKTLARSPKDEGIRAMNQFVENLGTIAPVFSNYSVNRKENADLDQCCNNLIRLSKHPDPAVSRAAFDAIYHLDQKRGGLFTSEEIAHGSKSEDADIQNIWRKISSRNDLTEIPGN